MFRNVASLLYLELSKDEALAHARQIHRLERRFSYKNFHRSAEYCADALRKIGLSGVELVQHPADGATTYMDCIMSKAWDVQGARLEIVEPAGASPRVLADWNENPFCIAQWSSGTAPRGVEADIISEEEMRAGAEVRGKMVLNSVDHHPRCIKKEVAERGGIGVVSDWTENYLRTPDGVYWNNEWSQSVGGWYGGLKEDEESPIWCISISPRIGAHLRQLMKAGRAPVRLRANIRAKLYAGSLPTVTGVVPGASGTRQEVLLIAHLYEPMPNDNAVGVAAVLEVVRAIRALGAQKKIPLPKRSIRVVFSQEMCGLAAYLATHPVVCRRAVAAVNMDSVAFGARRSGRPVRIAANPDVQASFTDTLFSAIAEHCLRQYAPLATWQVAPSSGDDNFIVDPTIGIPTNRFLTPESEVHHNSLNDWSVIDPDILQAAMTVCGTFAHVVAAAGAKEAAWLAHRVVMDARSRMDKAAESLLTGALSKETPNVADLLENVRERLSYIGYVETRRLERLNGIGFRDGANGSTHLAELARRITMASRETMERAESLAKRAWRGAGKPVRKALSNDECLMQNIIPKRKTAGPMVYWHRAPQGKRAKVAETSDPGALMWVDGKRNLLEIARLVTHESGGNRPNARRLLASFRALNEYGYLDIRHAMTLNKPDIKTVLTRIGVKKNDIIFMHSSLSHCGPIRGGADTVIAALMETVTAGGTLLMPTNYDNGVIGVTECAGACKYPLAPSGAPMPWDPAKSAAYTGIIANTFWQRNDVIRSNHPTHSVAAWGRLAEEFVRGHEPGTACCGRDGPYGKMVDHGGKFLYFGCTLNSSTFLHALEDWADLGYMPTADVLMQQGDKVVTVKAPHYPEGCRSFYGALVHKVTRAMDELGIKVRKVPLGFSGLKLVRARDFSRLSGALQKNPDLLLCDRAGCAFCTWARAQIKIRLGR